MKRLLFGICSLLALATLAPAQSLKFSEFTDETAPADTDYAVGFRPPGGVAGANRKFTFARLRTYVLGTSSPGLIQGTNITITGTWPNQTINAIGGGSGVGQSTETVAAFSDGSTSTTLARPSGSDFHTAFLTASAGSGAYTRIVVLNTTNTPTAGDQIRIVLTFPASMNPTIEVRNATSGGTLLDTVKNLSATADTIQLDYIYVGSAWSRASSNATRINALPNVQTSVPVDGYFEGDSASLGIFRILGSNIGGGGGGGITALTGDVTASGTGSVAATLAASGASAGTYGSATQSPQITVDAKGRITAVANVPITGGGGGSSTFGDLANYYQMFEDFDTMAYGVDGNGNQTPTGWSIAQQGPASSVTWVSGVSKHPGIVRIATSNSGNNRFILSRGGVGATPGQGAITFKAKIRVHLLNNDAGSVARIGFLDNTDANGTPGNAIYFEVLGTGAVNFKTASGSTPSTSSTGATVTLDTWYLWEFTVNAGGTSVQAKIDGVNAGSAIVANIPSIVTGVMIQARDNNSGTTATNFDVDYISVVQTYTSAR